MLITDIFTEVLVFIADKFTINRYNYYIMLCFVVFYLIGLVYMFVDRSSILLSHGNWSSHPYYVYLSLNMMQVNLSLH